MASYARDHGLNLRPHTKTHKSILIGQMQMDCGAVGLTVAKVGEAQVMAEVSSDLLMAYPAVDRVRCEQLARLARDHTVRVAVDSIIACQALAEAAHSLESRIGILVDLDVGHHRTGVQSPAAAIELAEFVERQESLRLDGLLFFPGQISGQPAAQEGQLRALGNLIWVRYSMRGGSVGSRHGSFPADQRRQHSASQLVTHLTEIRPGTYVFNDMNCVHGGSLRIADCAARIVSTIVSTAVPGQVVLDAGTKTLTSDRCGPAPESGHGFIVEFPEARITRLNEEHGQVDVSACLNPPRVGDRVTIIPNHICPCVNLQDTIWWSEPRENPRPVVVDARGKVY